MGELWDLKRKSAGYRRREPENTSLYRLVYNYHEELEQEWDERYFEKYGYYRPELTHAFSEYLDCGIIWRGCMRASCENCNHSILVANSCTQRGICPSCASKRGVLLAEHIESKVLSGLAVRHIVFTIPKRIRVFFMRRRANLKMLFSAARETLSYFGKEQGVGLRELGAILSVQTAGEALGYNPHLHGVLVDGHESESGFIEFSEIVDGEQRELSRYFGERVLRKLVQAKLYTEELAEGILLQENTGFSVWLGDSISSEDSERKRFLVRYIERAPISDGKLELVGETVILRSGNEHVADEQLSPLDFLAKLSLQIPNKSECMLRYYGTLSYRQRGERAQLEQAKLEEETELTETEAELISENCGKELSEHSRVRISLTWAICIKKMFEVDPLKCPKCGCQMQFKAAMRDEKEIERIAEHLGGYAKYHAPPKITEDLGVHIEYDEEYL